MNFETEFSKIQVFAIINGLAVRVIGKIQGEGKFLLESGEINAKNIQIFEIVCESCGQKSRIKWEAVRYHLKKTDIYYLCSICKVSGERNPFYGKHHTDESKKKFILSYGDRSGEKNPFWGKTHSQSFKDYLAKKFKGRFQGELNPFYGRKHSKETIEIIRQKNIAFQATEEGKASLARQRKSILEWLQSNKYRKTEPERKVEAYLIEKEIPYKYNFILNGKYQYDFRIENTNFLVEVHGDYWHANPRKYSADNLTDRQSFKVKQDRLKKDYAELAGYSIIYIWEFDINQKDFSALTPLLTSLKKEGIHESDRNPD